MLELDHVLRGTLAGLALVTLLLSASFFGSIWPERGWPIRVVCVGLAGVLVYGLVGQFKALNLGIPFDAFSWVGLIAYTVLVVGLGWFVRDRHHSRGR
jgi:hypothetical protein